MQMMERPERPERGFDDAYSVGWAETDPLAEIRQFRMEIQINDTFQHFNKENKMDLAELVTKTIDSLQERYKYKPQPDDVLRCMNNFNFRYGHLVRDPKEPAVVLKGRFF